MNEKTILERARDFYSKISKRYSAERYYERVPLNIFWREQNMPVMCDIIENANGPEALVHRAHQTFMFSVNVEAPIKERAVDWLLAEQRSRGINVFSLPPEIQESVFSYPGNNVERHGRRLTPDFIRTVNIGHQLERYFKPGQRGFHLVELGGGLGHLARTVRLLGYSRSHVIVDLPETLVFSYCFLSLNFPEAQMLLVEDENSASAIATGNYDFAFVPALFADVVSVGQYDLFINTASLGEMPNRTIRYWMNFIQNSLTVQYIYTLNRYLNTIDPSRHAWRWEENECSVHYDRRWEILQWELEPSFTRCPYIDTMIARYLEIAAERIETVDEPACQRRAKELLQLVHEEDWYSSQAHSKIMMRGDHILGHDLGIDGTLFKLWNSLRLQPSAEGIATLLRYLETLLARKGRAFEEERFYQNLFFELFDEGRDSNLHEFAVQLRKRLQSQNGSVDQTLLENIGRYNIVSAGGRFIAIDNQLGPVNVFHDHLGERELSPILLTGESLDEVRKKALLLEEEARPAVELIGETREFNLVKIRGRFLAVAKSIGPTNLLVERLGEKELAPILFMGESLEEVREKSMAREINAAQPVAELVDETAGFNLVRVNGKFLALAKSLGPTSLLVERLGERELAPILLTGNSLEEARERALSFERQRVLPEVELVEETGDYNIVKSGEHFIAIARKLGPVNLFMERLGERDLAPLILIATDLSTLRLRITDPPYCSQGDTDNS